ncbi:ATP-dependent 6-phosphofructokinase, partial [uncultured Ruthenibacterium sp.]|uniref:ATP-dependent 6-phosphofructokinase n=1 Tax=uncultured Ruthenibacterium sp. TaxID=1905347 RepID=UPI00349EB867
MASEIKTIGVLTSGGDAPGMNAAIRAVVRSALFKGYKVKGIRHGYNGLLTEDIIDMNLRSVSEIIHRGGTILYTARCLEFKTLEGQQKAADACRKAGIDALVVIGGDGSFRGAKDMAAQGIPCIGIPGTIDNDIACSDYTIGYDTAMNTAVEMIDKLRDTTQSHDRCSVVEVMGRNAGYIALNTGIAVGALVTLIPEVPFDLDRDVISKMKGTQKTGKKHFIIVVAEGAGKASEIANEIQARTGIDSRATVLGHVQRGGS